MLDAIAGAVRQELKAILKQDYEVWGTHIIWNGGPMVPLIQIIGWDGPLLQVVVAGDVLVLRDVVATQYGEDHTHTHKIRQSWLDSGIFGLERYWEEVTDLYPLSLRLPPRRYPLTAPGSVDRVLLDIVTLLCLV